MVEVIAAEALSALIGLIYDCAIDPARWPTAMEAMRIEFGLYNSSLDLVALPGGEGLLNYTTNIPEPYATRMADYAPYISQTWGGTDMILALPFTEPQVMSRLVGMPNDSQSNPLYTDWAKPQGVCDILGIFLARDARGFGSLGFGRHIDAPPIDDRVIDLARLLVPHVQRAAAINRLLDLAALRHATFDALFDTLSAPVLLIGAELRIVHANRSARHLLNRGDALRARGDQLAAVDRAVHHAIAVAIADARNDCTMIGRKGLGIPLARDDGTVGAIHVLPLRPKHAGSGPLAALFIAEAATTPASTGSIVAALFGLTPAESAVFDHITAGRTVRHSAQLLGVEPSTVRTHLLRLYDKTGIRRQAELVKLSAALAAPAASAE